MKKWVLYCFFLSKEQVADENSGNAAYRISQQTARYGVASLGNAYTTEVDRQDVEGGIGRTLQDTSQSAYERVGTVVGHGIDHESTGTASAQWLHEGCRKTAYPVAVQATEIHYIFNSSNQVIHGT